MFVTPLNFEQVLDRFYNQSKYDLMLLFVSSFDGNDRAILRKIVDNAKRIDRITGDRICFFYFIKDAFDSMNESLTRWVKNISNWTPLYGEGVSVTMETADDICHHFGLLRSDLPAFILIRNNRQKDPQAFTIQDYNDFEIFLTPLNILHSYMEDCDSIKIRYEQDVQRFKGMERLREKWKRTLQELVAKKDKSFASGMLEEAGKYDSGIKKLRDKLNEERMSLPLEENMKRDLEVLKKKATDRLNISLNSHDGEYLIDQLQSYAGYSETVLKIWNLVRMRKVSISRILEKIRYEIHEHGYDVFISCKSQDYALAHELYDYLVDNGFKPFLADASIKEVGIDQYTALIGEVINVCQNMIVFATDVDYIETPYVAAEWHTFVNDINTGHKPNAKLVNVLAPNIDVHNLPSWLRDKQCFTTENYKDSLLHFLKGWDKGMILLVDTIEQKQRHEQEAWYEVVQINSADGFRRYLEQYPQGMYAKDATMRLNSMMCSERDNKVDPSISFFPKYFEEYMSCAEPRRSFSYSSFWDKIFNRATYKVYSSIFAPAEVQVKSHMIVQVYLHLPEEIEEVKGLAQESDENAKRRDYIPLQCRLKKGDEVDIQLNIYGEALLVSDKKSVVWQGSFTKCSFDYFVPKDIDVDELSCMALLSVNGIPVGEMRFVTKIVEAPRKLNPEIIAHKYNKVFISYAHKDEAKVKSFHEGLKLAGIENFFDRTYLKAGDIFPQVIQDYINSADLFVLFWSENASKSEYVQKEYKQALELAFPQVKPQHEAKLSIYPMSIEPHAELPNDMKDNYHFGEM